MMIGGCETVAVTHGGRLFWEPQQEEGRRKGATSHGGNGSPNGRGVDGRLDTWARRWCAERGSRERQRAGGGGRLAEAVLSATASPGNTRDAGRNSSCRYWLQKKDVFER
mmetsp:Transcript_42836/g.85887  ORF Transcript_42836/g.85887 Transcript_42836/m.85887 type:complete len:110 (+) Transcript_42836:1580-1909(+)